MTEWVQITDIAISSATAIVVAGLAGTVGIISWRKQMIAERKMNLAEEILGAVYQAQDVIEAARQPFSWGDEGRGWRENDPGNVADRPEAAQIDAYYSPFGRLDKHREFFSGFRTLLFRSQAVFGDKIREHFLAILHARHMVEFSSRMLAKREYELIAEDAPFEDRLRDQLKAEIGLGLNDDDDDPIKQNVATAVEGIEGICRPTLDEPPSLWPWS